MIYLSGKHDMRFQHQAHAGVMTTPNDWWPQDWLLGFRWAADTGSYTNPEGYSTTRYLQWLTRKKPFQAMCLFATAPDVVGEPVATWDKAEPVLPQIRALGYSAALVAQDGVEECPIDWTAFDAWFVGGTTKWKLSSPSYALMAEARARGKHVHMGRVNSWRRVRTAAVAGCHSVDGTYATYAPDVYVPHILSWMETLQHAPPMMLPERRREA